MIIHNGQFVSNRRFKREDLIFALLNYKPHKNKSGNYNPNYKNGKGEQYVRIRINGMKVKRSHIVWMIWNKKNRMPVGKDIHHKNENKRDDSIRNLEIVDHVVHGKKNLKNGRKSKISYGKKLKISSGKKLRGKKSRVGKKK